MIKYTHAQKMSALRMLDEIGPARTKEETGIPATTLYRWKKQHLSLMTEEPHDAGLLCNEDEPHDDAGLICHNNENSNTTPEENQTALTQIERTESDQPDDIDAIRLFESTISSIKAENRKLRSENEHLRVECEKYRRMLLIVFER